MTKFEFLEALTLELARSGVADVDDIIGEYEQHFAFKLADGYSEEEIAARLGDPKNVAAQYDAAPVQKISAQKAITVIGLSSMDLFFGVLVVILYIWGAVMAAGTVASAMLAVALIGDLISFPYYGMPFLYRIVFGVASIALSALLAVGTAYFFAFVRQMIRSFIRSNKNTLASTCGKAVLPSLTVYPQFADKTKRMLRRILAIAVVVFAVCFVTGYVGCAIEADSLEFWHAWGWFGYWKW